MVWGKSLVTLQLVLQLMSTGAECSMAMANNTFFVKLRNDYAHCMTVQTDNTTGVFCHNEHRSTPETHATK